MSNSKTIVEDINNVSVKSSSFEDFIIKCCEASEPQLREWLKRTLVKNGFVITEDDYVSERAKHDEAYKGIHNMLAVRGNPRVCLVAHTDVCRDHANLRESVYWSAKRFFAGPKADFEKARSDKQSLEPFFRRVNPVIKEVKIDNEVRQIIQDKDCAIQVGGDDRLGVAINTWIALHTAYDIGLLFTTDEEIGLKSADYCKMKELMQFDLCVQTDRGNHCDELVIKIGGTTVCDYDTAANLLSIAYDIGTPRKPVTGMGTDIAALKKNNMIKQAVNMTCGYHESHSSGPKEYIDIHETRSTMRYVASIVRDYELNKEENDYVGDSAEEIEEEVCDEPT